MELEALVQSLDYVHGGNRKKTAGRNTQNTPKKQPAIHYEVRDINQVTRSRTISESIRPSLLL